MATSNAANTIAGKPARRYWDAVTGASSGRRCGRGALDRRDRRSLLPQLVMTLVGRHHATICGISSP